jgi:hypothetical protein
MYSNPDFDLTSRQTFVSLLVNERFEWLDGMTMREKTLILISKEDYT